MPEDTITTGEIARRVDRLEATTTSGFAAMTAGLEKLADRLGRDYVQVSTYAAEQAARDARIALLEADAATRRTQSWQVRLALTAALISVPASVATAWLAAMVLR